MELLREQQCLDDFPKDQSSTFPQTDIYSSLNAEYRLLRIYTDTRAPLAGDEMRKF